MWYSFMVLRRATAYPWAEATRVASRRTVGAWWLASIVGLEGGAQALRVRNSVLGAACSPPVCLALFCLALCLGRASCTQAGVADWAGATVRDRVS